MARKDSNKVHRYTAQVLSIMTMCLIAASCNKGLTGEQNQGIGSSALPEVSVTAIEPSTNLQTEDLEISVESAERGYEVIVRAGIDTLPLDQLFFRVNYDPELVSAEQINLAKSDVDGGILQMALETAPGAIEAGLAATSLTDQPAVRAGDMILGFRLTDGPVDRRVSRDNVVSLNRPRNLELSSADGEWVLAWDYTNEGDTDQDGEVGVSDLTPIAIHYGESINNSWDDPRRHIDGDHNLEINMADITPIGQNYSAQVWAYQIEMSQDGESGFITVGQLLLGDMESGPGETVRFDYQFGAQYVPGAWYRVVALDRDLQFGPPSEAISDQARRMDPVVVVEDDTVTITVSVHNLDVPILHMNAVRVKYPAGFDYVPGSSNPGSPGGDAGQADGIWGSFATMLLYPPDNLFVEQDVGNGYEAIDFNVTVLGKQLDASPVGYGDLFNFQLINTTGEPLTLDFPLYSEEGILRNYYTDVDEKDAMFGNHLGFEVR